MASSPLPSELAAWIAGQRWFASKTRRIEGVAVADRVAVEGGALLFVDVTLDDGARERYAVPLLDGPSLRDALDDGGVCRSLLAVMAGGQRVSGDRGSLVGSWTGAVRRPGPEERVTRLGGEQSNTSVTFGAVVIVKHFRRLTEGVNPELEIGRFLTEHARFAHTPPLAGALEYEGAGGGRTAVAVAQQLAAGARDGWQWLLERLAQGDPALPALRRLGERTAALHRALVTPTEDPAFTAEPIGPADVAAWQEAIRRQVAAARAALAPRGLPDAAPALDGLAGLIGCVKLRHHGDFHLGQTLRVDNDDFMLIDFEGEPLRPLEERRRKHTPLRDVAGMLRSLHYAVASAAPAAAAWEADMRAAFLAGYSDAARSAPFLPATDDAVTRAVAVFELEKAAYEIVYEANNRPSWVDIPVRGFLRAMASPAAGRAAGAA
ncbi:MAG TPA: sugar phosphotransferase [Candidatus Limnocylindria bacterium]|nr:sugar phosphotransferase [Candidatus Limnocylindria bacterium]